MPFDGQNYETVPPVTQMMMLGRQKLEGGWCQHMLRRNGYVCMVGSLTLTDLKMDAVAQKFMYEAIREYGYSHSTIEEFNDDKNRTKEQVLEVYDRAIELSMLGRPRLFRKCFELCWVCS
jgi:hypothetical protein